MKLIQRIKDWLFTKSLLEKENTIKISTPTTQEDPAVHEAKKRVRKAFKQQANQMQSRRTRPHSMNCDNPDICTKVNCFKRVPDKVLEETKTVVIITSDFKNNIQE